MTPLRFLHNLIETARANRRSVVLPEGYDVRILRAAEMIARRDFCDLIPWATWIRFRNLPG